MSRIEWQERDWCVTGRTALSSRESLDDREGQIRNPDQLDVDG
jgi:hypothetical protein